MFMPDKTSATAFVVSLMDAYERVWSQRYALSGLMKESGLSDSDLERKVAEYLQRSDIRAELDYELDVFRKMKQQVPELLAGKLPTAETLEQLKRKIH